VSFSSRQYFVGDPVVAPKVRPYVVVFVGEEFVTVSEARVGAVVRSVTVFVLVTDADTFPAASRSQIVSDFAFSVVETVKLAGKLAEAVQPHPPTAVLFSRMQ
jgi:hypothetical protein